MSVNLHILVLAGRLPSRFAKIKYSSLEIKGDVPVVSEESVSGETTLVWWGDNELFVPTSTPNVMDLRRVRCVVNNDSGRLASFIYFNLFQVANSAAVRLRVRLQFIGHHLYMVAF